MKITMICSAVIALESINVFTSNLLNSFYSCHIDFAAIAASDTMYSNTVAIRTVNIGQNRKIAKARK